MARLVGMLLVFSAVALLLPHGLAQDKGKKDADKEVKKDEDKKKDAKGDAPKDEKKDDKKDAKDEKKKDDDKPAKKKEPEEKLVYGQKLTAKIKRIDANSARDFAIDLPQVDPMKVAAFNQWKAQRLIQIMQQQNPVQRSQQMLQFQAEMARKQNTDIYSMKEVSMRAAENCKVRSMFLPVEFDDRGFPKKYTAKEIAALKGGSKLPGFTADFDRLREGQVVELYLAKTTGQPVAPKKKNLLDDEDGPVNRPEVVMIVIIQETPMPR